MSYITWAVVGILLVCTHTCYSQVFCRHPTCPMNSRCSDYNQGIQYCVCGDGYRLNAAAQCVDIDECRWDICGSSRRCVNHPGSYECVPNGCVRGYTGSVCTDIDECEFPVCGRNGNCVNYWGLYECRCYSGYEYRHIRCVDFNECLIQNSCDGNATCKNLLGTYSCMCNDGFSGNGTHCEDVDECTEQNPCNSDATCGNFPGTFNCMCNDGFSGNGTHCEDLDECIEPNPCDGNATCKNLPGTYSCVCTDGFSGNGTQCEAASSSGLSADSASVAVGVIFGCIIIALAIILVIFMLRRRKRQKATPSANPHNNTTSGQPEDPNLYSNNLVKERKILMKQLKQSEQENLPEASGDVYENQPTIIQDGGSSYDTLWKSGGSGQPFPDSAQTGNDDTYNHLNSKTVTSSASTEETVPANLYNHLYSGTKD